MSREQIIFPDVTGTNLLRQKIQLPADFEGEFNIVLIAFQQWQQSEVDTWVPTASALESEFPGFVYYELPTIYKLNTLSRWFINEGMRAGIPNPKTRRRTITLYLDKNAFRRWLSIETEDTITVLLVARSGSLLWRTTGPYTLEKAAQLRQAIIEIPG